MQRTVTVLVFVASLVLLGNNAQAVPSDKNTRDNGVEWIRFGPAVIEECKRIDISFEYSGGKFTVRETDEIFQPVKDWVKQRISKRINLSPNQKCHESVAFTQRIALYSSDTRDPQKLLLSFPLTPITLGVDKNSCKNLIQDLRTLLESK